MWNGKRLGVKKAKRRFDLDNVYESDDLKSKLKEFLVDKKNIYCDLDSEDSRVKKSIKYANGIKNHKDISSIVQKLRLKKSKAEIVLIQKAIDITKEAHHQAIKEKKEGKKEYELQAEIEYIFKKRGAYSDAYTSIVAGGDNANILHYIKNDEKLNSGDLILIDAGCEYEYYASDITRVIPVSGKFTQAQKDMYGLVLSTQLKIIKMIKPGIKRTDLQKRAEELLTKGMIKLGILKGDHKKLIKKAKHKRYYPHGIGHWLGIDVHDQAPYFYENKDEIPLSKGMILTIEPGIYIKEDDKRVPKKYRGIGIRIEDDILVTKNGHKNMSKDIIKSIKGIEKLSNIL